MSAAEAVRSRGEYKVVPIDSVSPNDYNYNEQDAATFDSLRASFARHGAVQPVICRRKGRAKKWEVINGEHRWRVLKEAGATEIAIIDLGTVSDTEAMELTVLLNEISGTPDEVKLATVLQAVHIEVDFPDLAAVMPFQETELSRLLETASAPPPGAPPPRAPRTPRAGGKASPPAGGYKKLKFNLSEDDFNEAAGILRRWGGDANKILLEGLRLYDRKRKAAEARAAKKAAET